MASVNANVRAALPTVATDPSVPAPEAHRSGWTFTEGLSAAAASSGSLLQDAATLAGAETHEDGSLKADADFLQLGGAASVPLATTGLMATRNRIDPMTGAAATNYWDRLGMQAASNGIRVTPTLVSAVAGPAIADGVSMIAPNLVKKYKDTKTITDATLKKQQEQDNKDAKWQRLAAGGIAVGLGAGVLFLLKPGVFSKFQKLDGTGLVDRAIQGTTKFSVDGGAPQMISGNLDELALRAAMARNGKKLADDSAVDILGTVAPMRRDAAFTNRAILGSAGGLGTLLLANNAAGQEDPERKKLMLGMTAAAGALTMGGVYGIGKLTQRSIQANSGAGGLLAKNDLLMKPNIEWIKKYAGTIAPITAVPAGTAASQYFNIVDDFDDITATRSPFRK